MLNPARSNKQTHILKDNIMSRSRSPFKVRGQIHRSIDDNFWTGHSPLFIMCVCRHCSLFLLCQLHDLLFTILSLQWGQLCTMYTLLVFRCCRLSVYCSSTYSDAHFIIAGTDMQVFGPFMMDDNWQQLPVFPFMMDDNWQQHLPVFPFMMEDNWQQHLPVFSTSPP